MAVPFEPVAGTRVTSECDFRVAGALIDPATVRCRVKSSAGVVTVYTYGASPELTRAGTGSYACGFTAAAAGPWAVRWEGTGGGVEAVEEALFSVRASSVI